jgi:hypothetical protein
VGSIDNLGATCFCQEKRQLIQRFLQERKYEFSDQVDVIVPYSLQIEKTRIGAKTSRVEDTDTK